MGAMHTEMRIPEPGVAAGRQSPPTNRRFPSALLGGRLFAALRPVGLALLLSLLVAILAYQAPPAGRISVGWLGDRLFLQSNPGLGQAATLRGDLYPDDYTPDSPTRRSRWTRQQARIELPNLGAGTSLDVTLLLQGWPADVVGAAAPQPLVMVRADGTPVGAFAPTPEWREYTLTIPAGVRQGADLILELETSATFTDTLRGADPRPKGVRLAGVQVRAPAADPAAVLPPAWRAVALLTLAALLLYALLMRLIGRVSPAFVLTALAAGLAGGGLALLRIWMGAALSVALWALAVALALAWQRPLLALFRALLRRYSQGRALGYGLVTAALAWLGYSLAHLALTSDWPVLRVVQSYFPDALMYGLLSVGLLALAFVRGRDGLPRVANGIVAFIGGRRPALALLATFAAIWLGHQASVIAALPYVGHADYSDNAVVARNLAAGRGWVVDYVTQFYRLYDGVTRPQETWPLLQPVWMAPFIALFGPQAWAAKIPNLLFNVALIGLIYTVGARLWDRRVGLVAVALTLTTEWFFNLTIFTTSDLGFVVFAMGALYLLYRGAEAGAARRLKLFGAPVSAQLLAAGVLTGLMMLQKPSGAVIAVGMGLWLLFQVWRAVPRGDQPARARLAIFVRRGLALGLVWALPALLMLSPYLARNIALFGKPVYSTESHDAWVLGYRGDSGIAWEEIYRVYTPELGGPGVPDRSWILRWGFDYTFAKFQTQLTALRDYLLPPWAGLPAGLAPLSSRLADAQSKNLITPLGAWLACLGLIVGLRTRRRLLSLLAFAFLPYMLFMATYWRTNEERYWVMLVPWLALFAAWMVWAGFDRLARIGDGRWSPLGLILAAVAVAGMIQPWWPAIAHQVQATPPKWQPDLVAYAWLKENTPPGTVIMARNPWQLNWHAERPAVMIPNTADRELLLTLARHYNAEYLILENLLRIKGDAARNLAALSGPPADVQVGARIEGFELVYASPTPDNRVLIYRFPEAARSQ